jgi:hypothetical protein
MFKQIIFVLDAEQYFPESLVIGAAREKTVQQKAEAEKRQAKQGAPGTYSVQSLRNSNLPIPSMLFI